MKHHTGQSSHDEIPEAEEEGGEEVLVFALRWYGFEPKPAHVGV